MTSDPIRDIEDPLVYGVRMSRATTCDILQAFKTECIQLGHYRAHYPFEDRRVVARVGDHRVSRAGDDPLDEGLGRLPDRRSGTGLVPGGHRSALRSSSGDRLRRMEYDDVTRLGIGEVENEPVDQDPLADLQGRQHRARGNLVRLDHERLDE